METAWDKRIQIWCGGLIMATIALTVGTLFVAFFKPTHPVNYDMLFFLGLTNIINTLLMLNFRRKEIEQTLGDLLEKDETFN